MDLNWMAEGLAVYARRSGCRPAYSGAKRVWGDFAEMMPHGQPGHVIAALTRPSTGAEPLGRGNLLLCSPMSGFISKPKVA